MFKVVDALGNVQVAYGTFIDDDGNIQFILCNHWGEFYKTDYMAGYYRLYKESE